jgi:hypothetical protein
MLLIRASNERISCLEGIAAPSNGQTSGKEGNVTANVVETGTDPKNSQPVRPAQPARKPRTTQGTGLGSQRFFLAKPGSGGTLPELDKEFATEPEAIVESLKTGRSYFTVSEWRGMADFSGRKPQLRKELVSRAAKSG